jgi:hypothetical protein
VRWYRARDFGDAASTQALKVVLMAEPLASPPVAAEAGTVTSAG